MTTNGMDNGVVKSVHHDKKTKDEFKYPAFLLCPPTKYQVRVANNIWMREQTDEELKPDYARAMKQFVDFYRALSTKSLVYILPCPDDIALQDLVFTANLGIVLSHLPNRKVAIISNFTTEPRFGETAVGVQYFKSMGYETFVPETKFEGEADLKYLHGNVYVGGYGMRSSLETYKWMEKLFDMKIICVKITNEYFYHLDCSIFPLTPTKTLVCKEIYTAEEVKSLEEVTEIIDVDYDLNLAGICNSLRLANTVYNTNNADSFKHGSEEYECEIRKNKFLKQLCSDNGLELEFVILDEYMKGGGLLSCMVLHMNRHNY